MQAWRWVFPAVVLTIILSTGCAPGHSPGGPPNGTTVTFTFVGGTPTAAATQISGGAFTTATITSGKLTVSLPSATAKYAVAYVCPAMTVGSNNVINESVIEATPADGTAFTISCLGTPATGTATGSANALAIPGATDILIRSSQNLGGNVGSTSGSFSVSLPTGTNNVDVAAIAVDASGNVLAVKIVRAQTVPGAINGGNQIVFAASDEVSTQSINVNNVPAGDTNPPSVFVNYFTANGAVIVLNNNTSATSYPAVASTETQAGDFYLYQTDTSDTATHKSAIGVTQTTTTGGSFTNLALPTPWSFSGPTAAAFPTFTFTYTGFNGLAAISQEAELQWAPTGTTVNTITVTATSSFQNGATTITIPNLTALAGFLASATSGTTVTWVADIFGGTTQDFIFLSNTPSNATISVVQNQGTYLEP
ncbi:MAG TPA: hypothetical protein VKW06_09105 [Candidatus Angelobacter sp.]|nr:hypothetical protein [Candidatus Angelobacter sp.]